MNIHYRSRAGARRRAAGATLFLWLAATLPSNRSAAACDICAVYTATEMGESRTGFRLGLAEQYTNFNTIRRDGHEIDNVANERVNSSITQVVLGYGITPRFGLQLTLPIISRQFRRLHDGRIEHGDESGVGDLSLIGNLVAYSDVTADTVFRFSVLGGLKLPTGDSARLAEELEEGGHGKAALRTASVRGIRPRHAAAPTAGDGVGSEAALVSGVHGHDLALGSGSVDGIIGASVFWSWRRFFVTAATQFAIRGEGDFDYQFAHDLTWLGGPGVFALLSHQYSLGVQAVLSGETKGKDTQQGVRADDTGITALYVGPGFNLTWGTSLAADVALDLPAVQNNTSVQIVPDYRIRGGVTWRF
jgi:hypothetical protein